MQRPRYYFWRFVHNLLHNLYWLCGEWGWVDWLHDWSGKMWEVSRRLKSKGKIKKMDAKRARKITESVRQSRTLSRQQFLAQEEQDAYARAKQWWMESKPKILSRIKQFAENGESSVKVDFTLYGNEYLYIAEIANADLVPLGFVAEYQLVNLDHFRRGRMLAISW